MDPNDSPEFPPYVQQSGPVDAGSLPAWVAETLPAMAEAEAQWQGSQVTPAAALLADDSPLQAYLRSDGVHPEGATRAEQADFYAARDAARDAAVQAAQDAARDHARYGELLGARAAADWLDGRMSRASKAQQDRESGATAVPVRDASKAPEGIGRW